MAGILRHTLEKISDRIHSFSTGGPAQAGAGVNKAKAADGSVVEPPEEESLSSRETHLRDIDWIPIERRRQKFVDLYLFAVDACLRGNASHWWLRIFAHDRLPDSPEALAALKEFCLHHLLYEAGDVPAFRRIYEILEQEGCLEGDDSGRFLLKLTQFVDRALRSAGEPIGWQDEDIRPVVPAEPGRPFRLMLGNVWRSIASAPRRPAVVSLIIPDDLALSNFFEFCLPSLSTERGLKSFTRDRAVSFLIYARQRDLPEIQGLLKARNLDCTIACQPIPEDLSILAEGIAGPFGEWLHGGLQYLHLMEAKRRGADFHSVNPNAVYADTFFEGILRLGERGESAVLLATFPASRHALRAELARYRHDVMLAISAIDLTSIGLGTLTSSNAVAGVQNFGHLGGTSSHLQLMWEAEDHLEVHTTHFEIALLSRAVVEKLSPRFLVKLSTESDRLLGADLTPHFVEATDGIAMLDLNEAKSTFDGHGLDFAEFGSLVSRRTRERQGEYFKRPVRLAISREACQQRAWRQEAEIANERSAVFRSLDGKRTWLTPTADHALTTLNVLHQYEASEYGLENLAGAVNEGRRLLDIAQTTESDIDDAVLRELIRASMNFDYVDKAIDLAKKGGAGTAFIHDFFVEMMKLKAANEAHAQRLRAAFFRKRQFAVIGSIAWGERFVDKFMNYCLPSLLAPGNIPALARKRKVVHSIVTTEADRERIVAHPAFARLREVAEVVFTCFSPEFLERREQSGYNFYHFYGLLDHQSVFIASALEADLYLLPIDCVYSGESLKHFSAYLERDADCCSVAAIESDEPELRAWLDVETRRRANVLDLPGRELVQAASERPDRYFRSLIMGPDNNEFCAHPRELVWPFADGLAIHSIFMHPLAVSARLLSRPFHAPHENVDFALLPRLLQGDGRLKVIEDASEATLAHFGAPVTRDEYLKGAFSIRNFIEVHRYDYAVHRRFFASRQFFPCQNLPYALSADYAAELALIRSALVRYRFQVEPG